MTTSTSNKKARELTELYKEKRNLIKIKKLFKKNGQNPNTYKKIWKRLRNLPYADLPQYKEGFFYYASPEDKEATKYSHLNMMKDYRKLRKKGLMVPKLVSKNSNIPYYQCLYWVWNDLKEISKFVSEKIASIDRTINYLTLNW